MSTLAASAFANFGSLIHYNELLAYPLVYVGVIVLGNLAAFTALWFAFEGNFGPWGVVYVLVTLFIADVSADILWYTLGQKLYNTRLGNFIQRHLPRIPRAGRLEAYVVANSTRLMFLSKFVGSISFPVTFLSGWVRVNFKKFFRSSLVAVFLWVPFVAIVAYLLFSSLTAFGAAGLYHKIERLFIIGLVAYLVLMFVVSRVLRRFLPTKEKEFAVVPDATVTVGIDKS